MEGLLARSAEFDDRSLPGELQSGWALAAPASAQALAAAGPDRWIKHSARDGRTPGWCGRRDGAASAGRWSRCVGCFIRATASTREPSTCSTSERSSPQSEAFQTQERTAGCATCAAAGGNWARGHRRLLWRVVRSRVRLLLCSQL